MRAVYTPSPWAAFRDHPTCRDVAYIRPVGGPHQHGLELAVVYGSGVEKEKAAQLLAAAPMLLQELRNIANADTAEWDDRTEFEAWAKSRARAAIAKVNGPDGPLSPTWCASVDAELAATAEADAALSDIQIQAVRDAIAEALGDAYDCTRVWSAWGVGTMDQDDFQMVAKDGDRVAEIADAAIAAMRAPAPEITLPAAAVAEGAQLDGESLEQAS